MTPLGSQASVYINGVLVLPVPELCRCYSPLKTLRVQCLAQAPETTDIYIAGPNLKNLSRGSIMVGSLEIVKVFRDLSRR